MGHIARDHRIAGEVGQVGVNLGGDRMVVAGAEMAVGHQPPLLAAHDQRHLGVGLQFEETEDHLHAGAFKVACPADIGLLVEARLELDKRGDRLASLRGIDQRADDRAVIGGAVERLLDGQHVGIARGLEQELHHRVEGFIGVMDDQILFADRGERIAGMLADALGKAGIVGLELEIVARRLGDFRQRVERQQSGQHADAVSGTLVREPRTRAGSAAVPNRTRCGSPNRGGGA
jgi:hypothetical protein